MNPPPDHDEMEPCDLTAAYLTASVSAIFLWLLGLWKLVELAIRLAKWMAV